MRLTKLPTGVVYSTILLVHLFDDKNCQDPSAFACINFQAFVIDSDFANQNPMKICNLGGRLFEFRLCNDKSLAINGQGMKIKEVHWYVLSNTNSQYII